MNNSNSQTKLKEHKFTGKKLIPPLATLNMTPSSWVDDRLPEMLWAVLFTIAFTRSEVLERFKAIVDLAVNITDTHNPKWRDKPLLVTLSGISALDNKNRKVIITEIAKDNKAKKALIPMLFFESLPSKNDWETILGVKPTNNDWNKLAESVARCFFHQTQEATDCRWVKALYVINSGFVMFTTKTHETAKDILDYPTHTDEQMRSSRPRIRSLEIGLEMQKSKSNWSKDFWDESYKNTGCISRKISKEEMYMMYPTNEQLIAEKDKLQKINQDLTDHFWQTMNNSNRDPKHEVAFGIALYASDLATSSILLGIGRTSQARMVLRSMVESLISLKYLIKQNTDGLWKAYQSHGIGQAKLVIQRAEEEKRAPHYLNQKHLGQIANDDQWIEFVPVDVGSWDDSDLRKRAIDVGLKEMYDDYYTWPSSFTHGQWGAIRESVYDLCENPLHRFHRIPSLTSIDIQDATEDIYLLLNIILDLLYNIYPKHEQEKSSD